ncbi:PEP/pyruvate-binding domain-containing protein [Blastococcus sp. PRF04-17]|uniref:PEP/pyruvate-binding domain-containing protein n=1 Tax=Blastococcus sp. PRF04-17 TaxID=2933797 RepID=UPI001FF38A84|nr:PEP/pyruvate-binding domain-containing protein [Blastococcus sp. PRF04-17]UOY01015.1 PEP-utilizing enzyme [Blastococcus sp. PRF04-17]
MTGAPRTADPTVVDLMDPAARDATVVGHKAATLAMLTAVGFPVPAFFVITADSWGELTGTAEPAADELAGAPLPPGLREQIAAALARLGGGPVAVRSSATAEDLPDASFAGQYASFLDVEGLDAVCDAVRRCVAAARSDRVTTYRAAAGAAEGGMAVLVQRMVRAEAAGVAFTANPVTGDRDQTLVSAVRGLGERLVSGGTTPDEWVVRGGTAECVAAPENALDAASALQVAEMAERLEDRLGTPQDVEWAIADGNVHVLQSRPITALPTAPALQVPTEGTWTKDAAHYHEPMTPLGASVYLPLLDATISEMFGDFGLLLDTLTSRSLGGEIYTRVLPVGGKEGPAPPWWVMGILTRVVPPLRRRTATARRVLRTGLLDELPARWERQWRDEFRSDTERLRTTDLAALSDAELEATFGAAVALLRRGLHIHFRLLPPYVVALHELATTCGQLLGWDTLQTLQLLTGLSETSAEPARALAALATQVRGRPEAKAVLADPGSDVEKRLAELDPALGAAFRGHLDRFGHRTLGDDPGSATLAERPWLLAGLLREAAAGERPGEDPHALRDRAEAEARRLLAPRSEEDRRRFDRALTAARRVYGVREDNVFWTGNLPCGLIRRVALEIGERLVRDDRIARPADVAYLADDELRRALRADEDVRELVARRRAERAWVTAHPGPAFHGPPPQQPPDVRGLPDEARRINAAFMWYMANEFTPSVGEAQAGLAGAPGSPGTHTGPVRVIRSEDEFGNLRPGDVLVARVTTPVWSVLFGIAGAVVTDGGGALSHTAIVAREHGIPAVLATSTATTELTDGHIVTVDGTAGVVRLDT